MRLKPPRKRNPGNPYSLVSKRTLQGNKWESKPDQTRPDRQEGTGDRTDREPDRETGCDRKGAANPFPS